jgi:solute carrier family 45, member 1/2/4
MGAFGSVIGYFIGSFDLVGSLPVWLGGDTQFKKMIVVALVGLWFCVGITSWAVTERRLIGSDSFGSASSTTSTVLSVLPTLWRRTIHLPPRIRAICFAQFWGWIGWFPFLFYSSTWVGETYFRYDHPPSTTTTAAETLNTIGRLGSVALVLFSLVTLTSSIVLPHLVSAPSSSLTTTTPSEKPHQTYTPRLPPSLPAPVRRALLALPKYQPSLITTWLLAYLSFAAIMAFAPFITSLRAATTLVALAGIPWSVSCWAPFAELGIEINRLGSSGAATTSASHAPRDSIELEAAAESTLHLLHTPSDDNNNNSEESQSSTGELSGVYLGVLNVYTTLPQFCGTAISWVVFSILEPSAKGQEGGGVVDGDSSKKIEGPNAIAVCLFIGALAALVGVEAVRRLRKIS